MALDYSPTNLLEENDGGVSHRNKYLYHHETLNQTYMGSYFRSDKRPAKESPENYPFSFIANVQPRLVFNNPKVSCKSANVAVDSDTCSHAGRAVNQWIRYRNFQTTLEVYAQAYLMLWSVALIEFETHPEDVDLPAEQMRRMIPKVHILDHWRYVQDPTATPTTTPRWKSHINVKDLEDVKKMKDLVPEALDSLIADIDLALLHRPNTSSGGKNDLPSRKEVLYYEMWVPECNDYRTPGTALHLENGTIFTIAVGQTVGPGGARRVGQAQFLRKPRPYFGPATGPYRLAGAYDVQGETYPLSPIAVCMQQVEELNAHCTAVANAAARMKNLVFVDATQDTLQSATMNSPDGTVLGIPGISESQIVTVVIGGPAKEQYQYIELLRNRLDRNIGIDDAQRGELNSDVTATATNVAFQSMAIRMDHLQRRFTEAVKDILKTVLWYAWESPNFVMFLAPDDAEALGMTKPAYLGGPDPQHPEAHVPIDQAALDIEPYSMVKVDETVLAQEVMDTLALVMQMAQEMQTAPWLGWETILNQLADIRKFDWLDDAINSDLFRAYQAQQQSQVEQTHAATMAEAQLHLESLDLDNKLKQLQIMLLMKQLQGGDGEEGSKGPSVSLNYKDAPEDVRRRIEEISVGMTSHMGMTAPDHVKNALSLATKGHDAQVKTHMQGSQQMHQQGMAHTSAAANMLRDMAKNKGGRGSGGQAAHRAQQGPTKTASKAGATRRPARP